MSDSVQTVLIQQLPAILFALTGFLTVLATIVGKMYMTLTSVEKNVDEVKTSVDSVVKNNDAVVQKSNTLIEKTSDLHKEVNSAFTAMNLATKVAQEKEEALKLENMRLTTQQTVLEATALAAKIESERTIEATRIEAARSIEATRVEAASRVASALAAATTIDQLNKKIAALNLAMKPPDDTHGVEPIEVKVVNADPIHVTETREDKGSEGGS